MVKSGWLEGALGMHDGCSEVVVLNLFCFVLERFPRLTTRFTPTGFPIRKQRANPGRPEKSGRTRKIGEGKLEQNMNGGLVS